MLRVLRAFLLICVWAPTQVQSSPFLSHSLKGRVSDSTGTALIGAVVTIPDLKAGATTDDQGNYLITNLPRGKYLIQVHLLGFSTHTELVIIEGVTSGNFTLLESILERSEVVVTGTSLATEQRKTPTPIISIRLKELEENAFTNIVDALSMLPGVTQVTTGPAISKPIIRGLGANRILTIHEGIRQEGQQWGDEHGIEIDDYHVSRVELLKGPASLAYGSDALAGVINIISEEPMAEGKTEGNLKLNYQSNNGLGAIHGNLGGNKNGFTWNGFATLKAAHDYRNAIDGPVFNSRFSNTNGGLSLGLNKSWGNSRLSFTTFNQNLGITEGVRDSVTGKFIKQVNIQGQPGEDLVSEAEGKSYEKQAPRQKINHHKIVWNNTLYLANSGRLGFTLGYQENNRSEFEDVLQPDQPGQHLILKTVNYDLKYIFPIAKGWQGSAGINGMKQKNENRGEEFLIPDYSLIDFGAYYMTRKDFKHLSLSGGVRWDHRDLIAQGLILDSAQKFEPLDRNFSNLTGSAGVSLLISKRTTLKLNFARGFRAPNIGELAANGVHEGTLRYEYGNQGLKSEQSLQTDLGLEYNSEHLYLNGAIFYNYIQNYIYLRKLVGYSGGDSIPEVHNEEGYPAYFFEQTPASLLGGELYIDLHPHPLDWLHLDNTISLVWGKFTKGTDSTRNLPFIPPARWLIELRVQKKQVATRLKNGYLKFSLDLNASQSNIFDAYETERFTPGYGLVHAGMGFDLASKKAKTICSVHISAQNLLDKVYQNHLSRLKYAPENPYNQRLGIFGMGRNISLLVSFPLHLN